MMEKHAINYAGIAHKFMRSPGSSAALGAGVGAVGNIGREALRKDGEPKDYLRAGLRGAAVGGVAAGGAAMGSGAVRDTMLLTGKKSIPGAIAGTAKRGVTSATNFAKRQVHGVTGLGNADAIGMGGVAKAKRTNALHALRDADAAKRGIKIDPAASAARAKEVLQGGASQQAARDAGYTTLPGIAKAFKKDPKAAAKGLWENSTGGSTVGKAMVALPAAMAAKEAVTGDKDLKQRGRNVASNIAMVGAGVLGGGLPLIPGQMLYSAADKFRGKKKDEQG